jgi:hypothetical protein
MHKLIKGFAASAAIVAFSSAAMAQGAGSGSSSTGQATWPDKNPPTANTQPATPSGAGTNTTPSEAPKTTGTISPSPVPDVADQQKTPTAPKN